MSEMKTETEQQITDLDRFAQRTQELQVELLKSSDMLNVG